MEHVSAKFSKYISRKKDFRI